MNLSDEQREKYYNVFLTLSIYTLISNAIFFSGCGGQEYCKSYPLLPNIRQLIAAVFFMVLGVGIKNEWDTEWSMAIWWWPTIIILFLVLLFNMIPWLGGLFKRGTPATTSKKANPLEGVKFKPGTMIIDE